MREPENQMPYDAVIFDLDGTLVDTESRNPVSVALEEIHRGKVCIRSAGSPAPERPDYKDPMTLQSEALAFVLGV